MDEPTRLDFSPEVVMRRWPSILQPSAPTKPPTDEETEQAEQRLQQQLAAERKVRAERLLANRGSRYEHCRLANYEIQHPGQQEAVDRLRSYLENMDVEIDLGGGVVLFGPSGTGKDHLLAAMAYGAVRVGGYHIEWRNGIELWVAMRSTIDGELTEREVINPLLRADVLVLSDPLPPTGELSDYQKSTLYRVMEARYSQRKPVWVTLNVRNGTEAGERLGVPNFDRMRDGALAIYCNWPSYRRPQ